jgi:AcrR family transcriptional regulator
MVYRQTDRSRAVREASRERILGAALKLFASKGYEGTTMQDIVALAGTSIGNAYFYFENKEKLVAVLAETAAHSAWDAAERATESIATSSMRIGAMLAVNGAAFLSGRQDVARLLAATGLRTSVIQIFGDVAIARWTPILSAAFPERSAAEIHLSATAMWGGGRTLGERHMSGKLDVPPRVAVEFLVRWSLRALDVPDRQIESIVAESLRLVFPHSRRRRA